MAKEDKLRRIMREFGRVFSEAISDSSEATHNLRQIRDEGYSLYLLLGSNGEPCAEATTKAPLQLGPGPGPARQLPPAMFGEEPAFRINGQDLSFLRSLGIDPTRQLRRRRG